MDDRSSEILCVVQAPSSRPMHAISIHRVVSSVIHRQASVPLQSYIERSITDCIRPLLCVQAKSRNLRSRIGTVSTFGV